MAGEVRQRRGAKKTKKQAATAKAKPKDTKEESTPAGQQDEESAWQTVKNHPLAMVLPIVLIPYCFYLAFIFLQLQRPDILSTATFGLVELRPAISPTDERQMLIVGTMSSGTVQVS